MPVIDMFSTVMNSLKEELLPDPPGAVEEDKYNFLLSERDRLLQIIRSSPITNQENGACYVACLELDKIHKELDEMNGGGNL
jgi:hypothetical protein